MRRHDDTPDETPSRLDLYVEKIVSYMNLDDAQRDDVVRELRSHLDEAVADGTARGMKRTRAEEAAMERFGSPEMLAGRFGTLRGKGWVVFESLAYALMVFIVILIQITEVENRPEFITIVHLYIISGITAFGVLLARLWNRVQVNGTLRVYRFLRPTLIIPFDAITEVTMKPWHLVGPRRVRIKYARGKTATFSAGWPNARCVGIAMEVLAPKTIQPKAADFFRKLRLKSGSESIPKKAWLTAGWTLTAAALASSFPLLWSGEGVSLIFAIAILGSGILLCLQYTVHVDRARRAVAILLIAAWSAFIPYFIAQALFSLDGPRPLVLLTALLFPLPAIILWWRGKNRAMLLAVVSAWLVAAFSIAKITPSNVKNEPRYLGMVTGITGNATWLTFPAVDRPVFATLGLDSNPDNKTEESSPFLALVQNGKATDHALESGTWRFAGGGAGTGNALLVRDMENKKTQPPSYSSEIYRIELGGSLSKLSETSGTTNLALALTWPEVAISPTGRYLLTSAMDSTSTDSILSTQRLAIVDLKTDKMTRHPNAHVGEAWRWTTSTTLELLRGEEVDRDMISTGRYEVLEINAAGGEVTSKRWLELGTGNTLLRARSKTHGLIRGNTEFGMVNLDEGTSVSLPAPREDEPSLIWDPQLNKAFYISGSPYDDKNWLTLAGPDGAVGTPIKEHYEIGAVDFAPDGKKAFMALRRTDKYMFPLAQLVVLNFTDATIVKIGHVPFIGTALSFIADVSGAPHAPVQWTPDSRSVMWTNFRPMYEEGQKPYVATEFLALDYEDN